jgi:regulator of protease activity HflC (stomatin/prohibitin superfamily)
MRKLPINLIKVVGTLFGLLILVLILNPFYQVPGGYAGVKTDFGAVDPTPLSPGLHFALPIAQSVSMVSTQPHTATSNEAAATAALSGH